MKTIEIHFIPNPQSRKSETGKAYRQPNDTDDILGFVFRKIAEGDFEIV